MCAFPQEKTERGDATTPSDARNACDAAPRHAAPTETSIARTGAVVPSLLAEKGRVRAIYCAY